MSRKRDRAEEKAKPKKKAAEKPAEGSKLNRSIVNKVLLVLAVLLAAYLLLGLGSTLYYNQGETVTQDRNVSGFSAIRFSGGGNLAIAQTGNESLQVESKSNLQSQLHTEVKDGTLVLEEKIRWFFGVFRWFLPERTYHITVEDLSDLTLSGSSNIEIERLEGREFTLHSSGSGDVTAAIYANTFNLDSSGSMDARVSGEAENQNITFSGSGDYDGSDMRTQRTNIDITGSGSATVDAADVLDVRISGSGDVKYKGSPQVNQSISGSGTIQRLD